MPKTCGDPKPLFFGLGNGIIHALRLIVRSNGEKVAAMNSQLRHCIKGLLRKVFRRGSRALQLNEKGSALILTIFLSTVGVILVVAAVRMIIQTNKETKQNIQMVGEADTAARAGIVETLSWFRAQASGVANNTSHLYPWCDESFFPRQTILTGTTQDRQTIDESIGLVREFQIGMSPNGMQKWVRYEVHRQHWPSADAQGTPYPTPTPGSTQVTPVAWDKYAAHDISGERILPKQSGNTPTPVTMNPTATATPTLVLPRNGDGNVWSIGAVGYVYLRPNVSPVATLVFNKPPCRGISQAGMMSEFRRVTMNGPWVCGTSAAVYTSYLSNVSILYDGTIGAGTGSTCIAYLKKCSSGSTCSYTGGSNNPTDYSSATQSESSIISTSCPTGSLTATNIFGMSLADLKKLADFSGTTVADMYTATSTPRDLASDKLFYLDGGGSTTFVFDDNNCFNGTGVFVVDGSLDIKNSGGKGERSFGGLIYVTGNTIIENRTSLDGALISLGTVQLSNSSATDWSQVVFNLSSLNQAQQNVLNFREDQTAVRIFTGIAQR